MKKLKNVIIINDFDYTQGGASKVAIDTANLLVGSYNVYFFSGSSNNISSLNEKIVRICTNQGESLKNKNKIVGAMNGIYNFGAKRKLNNLLMTLDKEETIVHIHGWTKCLSSSVFDICWKKGFKVVLTLHDYFTACPNGGYFNYKNNKICKLSPLSLKCIKCNCDSRNYAFKIYRIVRQFVQNKIVNLNDRLTDVISISEFSENILKKTLNSKVEIHRVYNPIDFENNLKKVDYSNNEYYLFVGRVSKEKGVDIFCRAISEMNLNGIIVGDGPEKNNLESLFPKLKFVGWKSPDQVKNYMIGAKALIFPSLWYEGAPLTPLEANGCGIPVLTSNCNAAVDYFKNKGSIFDDIEDLKRKVEAIENKEYTFEKIDLKKYSLENYIKNINKCYLDVMMKSGESNEN